MSKFSVSFATSALKYYWHDVITTLSDVSVKVVHRVELLCAAEVDSKGSAAAVVDAEMSESVVKVKAAGEKKEASQPTPHYYCPPLPLVPLLTGESSRAAADKKNTSLSLHHHIDQAAASRSLTNAAALLCQDAGFEAAQASALATLNDLMQECELISSCWFQGSLRMLTGL